MDQERRCPSCQRELQLAAFGRDRSQPDQKNLRCKECVARRMAWWRLGLTAEHRRRLHRGKGAAPGELTPAAIAPLVLAALERAPACTQADLLRELRARVRGCGAGRSELEDLLGDALGQLFDERRIATSGSAERRIYFKRVNV